MKNERKYAWKLKNTVHMTLSAISMLILCTCCCTSQAQLNTRTPEPDLFKNLLYKDEANSKQQQSRELTPVYEKPTSQEYDISDLTSDEMENLPHNIFHSIYESVLFPETPLDDPNSEKTQTNKVTDIIPKNSRITRQITRFGEKQQGTLQQTSSTKKLTETSSVPGSTKSKSDKPKTTSTPKQIQIGTGKTEESHVESTTILKISETPINPTNISTSDTIAAPNATTEVITSEQDTSTATLNLTSSETAITSVQTPINGSTSARTTRSESHTTAEAITIDQNASTATPNLTSSETPNTAHVSTPVITTTTTRRTGPITTEATPNLTSSETSNTSANGATSVRSTTTTRSTGPITTITSSENALTVTPNLSSSETSNTSANGATSVRTTTTTRSTGPITTITSSENALTVTPNLSSSETSNTSANGATSVRSTTTTGSTGTIDQNASTATSNLTSSETSNTSAQTSINVSSTRSIRSTSPTTSECVPAVIEEIYSVSDDTSIYFNFTANQFVENWSASVDNSKLELICDKNYNFCEISSLDQCTQYLIQLEVTSCNVTHTKNKTIQTKIGVVPQAENFQIITYAESKVKLLWEEPSNNTCNANISYTLRWQEIDGETEKNETTEEKNLIFISENFYKLFNVCIVTNLRDNTSKLYQSEPLCNISSYSSPGPPSKPTIYNNFTYENEVFIQYQLPETPNGNIDYMEYSLSKSECTNPQEWTRLEEISGDLSVNNNLTSCTVYCIQLRAVNMDIDGTELNGTSFEFKFTTEAEILPSPTNFSISDKNSTQFNLMWNDITTNCPHGYIIYIQSISNCYTNNSFFTTNQTNLLIENLTPYTTFKISIATVTKADIGEASEFNHTTDYSRPPKTFSTDPSCDSHKCHFVILVPPNLTGPTKYEVQVDGKPVFTTNKPLEICDSPNIEVSVPNLNPYTKYTIAIIASVENMTETTETIIITKPSEPGPPESLKVNCDFTPSEGVLDWEKPDEEGKRKHISDNVKIKAHNDLNDLPYSKILALWPDYNYTFRVRGKTQDVKDPGLEVETHCFKQAALAPEVNNEKFKESQIITDNSTAISIFINNDLFSDQNGVIINYSIIVYQQQDNKMHSSRLENLDNSLFWSDIKNANIILPYRTTPNHWNPLKSVLCQIGCNSNCSQVVGPCNGPLRSNTHYQVFIKAYTTAAKLNAAKNSSNGLVIALGVSTPILIILVCVLLVMIYRKEEVNKLIYRIRHNRRISSVFATTSTEQIVIENQSSTRPVQLDAFFRHYHLMNKDSGLKFSQEFEEIKAISPSFPMVAAHLIDHSRVKILPISDDITTDYINACYIPGFNSQREYIATQGPLPATKDDFWRMVWEQSCQMIVMVTQCVERGKRKCEVYWPEDREVHYYGDLAIQLRSESILSNFTIRLFDLFMGTKTLEVKQMHFTKWPDFGCPENTSLLINFVQAVREHTPHGFIGPFVIHCSAGVGRTGTYISVDRLMQHIQQHHYVDIYGLVLEMRQFRVNMVQTEDQYIYIHSCVRDLLMGKTASDSEPLYANICKGV
uniref:protein-tyrosine-phosphatase n=1 Tax=Strigamia maritima TaxID=126957 RepID=T1IQG3_STRMM